MPDQGICDGTTSCWPDTSGLDRSGTNCSRPRAMPKILFLDVDGAAFSAFEMASLLDNGRDVSWAGLRAIPEELKSGEFQKLSGSEIRIPWIGRGTLASLLRCLATRPARTVATLGIVLAAYAREPRYLSKCLATLAWSFSVARWAEEHNVEHLHANWAHLPATSAWIVSRLTGLPYSFSAHAGADLFRTSALLRQKIADARFIVVCNHAAEKRLLQLSPHHAAKIHLCYHGIDLHRFRAGPRPSLGALLSVGNLDPAKGFDLMIRAVALLRDRGRKLTYRIVGEGRERKRLEWLISELGLGEQVRLSGELRSEALVEAYHGASVFVAPSRILSSGGRDGLPNVILEAMACGIPVVGTDAAGIPEAVVHEQTGLLAEAENPAALADAVERLLVDHDLAEQMTRAGREQVALRFDRSKNVARFCGLFSAAGNSRLSGRRIPRYS